MDIQILGRDSLKIKSKKATLAVDPKPSIPKFDADGIILLNNDGDLKRINNYRVCINAAGEYEVGGLKISGISLNGDTMFVLTSENMTVLVAKASSLDKATSEKIGEYKVLVIDADGDLNQGLVTAMEPNLVIFYGLKAKEAAKNLGKGSTPASSKISILREKLPDEMGVAILA